MLVVSSSLFFSSVFNNNTTPQPMEDAEDEVQMVEVAKPNENVIAVKTLQNEDTATAVVKALNDNDPRAGILAGYATIMEAAKTKLPKGAFEPKQIPEQEPFSQQLSQVFETAPPQVWYVFVPCMAVLVAVLAFSPRFFEFLIVVGGVGVILYLIKTWESTTIVRAVSEMNTHSDQQLVKMTANSEQLGSEMLKSGERMHSGTLNALKSIVQIGADVKTNQIETYERMHKYGTDADVLIKSNEEEGKIIRNRESNQTRERITDIEAKTKEKVTAINAEKEKHSKLLEQQMAAEKLQNDLKLQTLESTTKTSIAEIDKQAKVHQAESAAKLEQFRISTNKDIEQFKESNVTERVRIDGDVKKTQVQQNAAVEIAKANKPTIVKKNCVIT